MWIKIGLTFFIHLNHLFYEWDNTIGNFNAKIFSTEMLTFKEVFNSQIWRVTGWTSATLSSPGTSRAASPFLKGRPWFLVTALGGWVCGSGVGEVLHGLFWDHITLIPGDILFQTHNNSALPRCFRILGAPKSHTHEGKNKNPEAKLHCFLVADSMVRPGTSLLFNELV